MVYSERADPNLALNNQINYNAIQQANNLLI
jgi:hypothetical protein